MMRTFDTGATRDTDSDKLDYDGFLSPLALRRYAEYLHKHRKQADGKMRDSDNWQKGIPRSVYMKSMFRHFFDVWSIHRGWYVGESGCDAIPLDEALCAVIFNAMGYLHELRKAEIEMSGAFDGVVTEASEWPEFSKFTPDNWSE